MCQPERLARLSCRPPIAQERIEETTGGKLRFRRKRPWHDGTIAIVLEPMDLLARLRALIPPPTFRLSLVDQQRSQMVRYHGHAQLPRQGQRRGAPEPTPRSPAAGVTDEHLGHSSTSVPMLRFISDAQSMYDVLRHPRNLSRGSHDSRLAAALDLRF